MLKERFTAFIKGKTAYGIDIVLGSNGAFVFYFVELELQKGEVNVIQKQQGNSVDALFELTSNKNIPVYLNIRGKGILSKKLTISKTTEGAELLRLALPNANADEFYWYGEECSEKEIWVQFTRKSLIDNWLQAFKKHQLSVVSVQIEFTALNTIQAFLKQPTLVIDGQELSFTKGKLQSIKQVEVDQTFVEIGEDRLNTYYAIPYASAFNHFTPLNNGTVVAETIVAEQEEYKQRKIFSLGVKFSLGFFLLLLLINFFFFQNYSAEYGTLSQTLAVNKSQLDRLKKLEVEKKNKEQFFQTTDLISASNSSFFVDRLALNKPSGVVWEELNINPSKRKIERGEEIEFNIKTIDLKGTTLSSALLNEWIASLNKENWVKSINIRGFQKQERKKNSKFSLQIIVK